MRSLWAELGCPPTARPAGKTPEGGPRRFEALAEQLTDAVAELTTSAAWVGMLRVVARFTRYSPTKTPRHDNRHLSGLSRS